MKVTNINARADSSGKHNDRNFDLDKAPHIDKSKVGENEYYTYNGETQLTFRELELEYYEHHFDQALEERNANYKKTRHPERVKTMEDIYTHKNTRPEDKILQIGDINEHATKEELWACALEYKDRFEEIFGDNCKILDMALHMDEATPHVHVRRVWFVEDEKGYEVINQTKALEELGIMPPRPDKPIGRYNNPKMSLTQTDIELFKSICFEHGLDIDMDTPAERKARLNTRDYKMQEHEKERVEIEKSINALANFIRENPYLINEYEDQLKEAEGKSLAERNKVLVKIMTDTYEKLHGQIDIANKHDLLKQYIEERGLLDDYDEWIEDRLPEEEKGTGREEEKEQY